MPDRVERFTVARDVTDPDGEWVRYSDYENQARKHRDKELRERLEKARKQERERVLNELRCRLPSTAMVEYATDWVHGAGSEDDTRQVLEGALEALEDPAFPGGALIALEDLDAPASMGGEAGVDRNSPVWARMSGRCAINRHDQCAGRGKDGGPCTCSCHPDSSFEEDDDE